MATMSQPYNIAYNFTNYDCWSGLALMFPQFDQQSIYAAANFSFAPGAWDQYGYFCNASASTMRC